MSQRFLQVSKNQHISRPYRYGAHDGWCMSYMNIVHGKYDGESEREQKLRKITRFEVDRKERKMALSFHKTS